MSVVAHIETLEAKKAKLHREIARESLYPMPNFTLIAQLKKQKLAIKEEMARLMKEAPDKRASAS